jgi:hypothetical protein
MKHLRAFLRGAGSVFDIMPTLPQSICWAGDIIKSDQEALAEYWKSVGEYIQEAGKKYAGQNREFPVSKHRTVSFIIFIGKEEAGKISSKILKSVPAKHLNDE